MSTAFTSASEPISATQLETQTSKLKTVLPNSRRIYIKGEQPGVRVPFREIDQNPTRNFKNELEDNPPVRVYDTSGDRKSTRLNSSHVANSYAVFCLKKKTNA